MRKAFTLSEILITLGIIGVVAAVTMPILIQKYQKHQTVNQLKKAYSEMTQAIRMSEQKYGTLETWDFSEFDTMLERAAYFGENYLFPNIKVIEKCIPTSSKCYADNVYSLDGTRLVRTGNNTNHVSFVTASGYTVLFWLHGGDNGTGGWFYIDINGRKKPNRLGKDVFPFVFTWSGSSIYSIGFLPAGLQNKTTKPTTREQLISGEYDDGFSGTDKNCQKGTNKYYAGWYCVGLIVYDGWQIKDDYPW